MKRRDFVRIASASLGLSPALRAAEGLGAQPAAVQAIRFGYAAITWGGNDRQAIEDVAALGFPGIQLRDVEAVTPAAGGDGGRPYRWVELGRGRVDLPRVFAALEKAGFKDWAIVELDAVPDKAVWGARR